MIRILTFLLLITSFNQYVLSQNKKVKFGKPTLEELELQVYTRDSSATAVILFDIGKFASKDITFTRHMRLKILKKEGLSWANWIFNTPYKSNFKVVVNTLQNGEIVSDKANSDNIFEQEVIDNYSVYKVFVPNVKVGSVIDIQFNHRGIPSEWRFQDRIPILYSELEIEESGLIQYSKSSRGFEPIQQIGINHWIAENMPAFQVEPYLSAYENYITKFQFQLISIGRGQGWNYYSFSTSWDRIIDVLSKHYRFGSVLNGARFLDGIAKNIKNNLTDTEEIIKAAYDSIQLNIKWNHVKSLLTSGFIRDNFQEDHSGNSADINLLYVALLNKLNIRAFPILLSTRDNGFLLHFHPSIDQLNYVAAYVKHDNIEMLIDATDINGRPGILPERCLNGKGLVFYEDATLWVDLHKGNGRRKTFTKMTINEDGTSKGVVNIKHLGYDYSNWVNNYISHDENEQLYSDNISKNYGNIKIDDYALIDHDRHELSSSEKIEVDLSDQLISTGNGYIFTPFILNEYVNNPFKSETRKYPVDMKYPMDVSSTVNINLPKGYQPKSIPQSIKLGMSEGGAHFTLLTQGTEKTIQLSMRLNIDKYIYTEVQYPELKRFFGEVSRLISQPIEIEKI